MNGDEVGAVVLDMGSSYTRCGFAGEDTPKAVFATAVGVVYGERPGDANRVGASNAAVGDGDVTMKPVGGAAGAAAAAHSAHSKPAAASAADSKADTKHAGAGGAAAAAQSATQAAAAAAKRHYYIGERTYGYYRDGQDIVRPVQHGLVTDWDAVEGLIDYSFRKWLLVDTKEHPLLVTDCNWNTPDRRARLTQLAFEKFDAPALFLCKNAVASSFSVGRATSLVLDVGGGATSAVPVHDGYVLHKGVKKTKLAGDLLDEWLLAEFQSAQKQVLPRYKFKREALPHGDFKTTVLDLPNTTPSYHNHMLLDVIRDVKESVCRVSENPFDAESIRTTPAAQYELPDGTILDVGAERFTVPEKLFAADAEVKNDLDLNRDGGFKGLHKLVIGAIEAVDVDIRKELYQGLVITGGTSLLNGLPTRLQKEMSKHLSPSLKLKAVQQSSKSERKFACWIGGSILASLGSFHQMWYSRQEYDEHGASLLYRKCP